MERYGISFSKFHSVNNTYNYGSVGLLTIDADAVLDGELVPMSLIVDTR